MISPTGMAKGDSTELFSLRVGLGALKKGRTISTDVEKAIAIVEKVIKQAAK